jgi:biopolymer transport protein ExbD
MITHRRRAVSLTPLIDVIFLLLLFFMLTASFTREGELSLPDPADGAAAPAEPAFLQVAADGLRLDRRPVTLEALPAALRAAAPDAVVVAFAPEADAQRLVDVLLALARLPDLPVALLD